MHHDFNFRISFFTLSFCSWSLWPSSSSSWRTRSVCPAFAASNNLESSDVVVIFSPCSYLRRGKKEKYFTRVRCNFRRWFSARKKIRENAFFEQEWGRAEGMPLGTKIDGIKVLLNANVGKQKAMERGLGDFAFVEITTTRKRGHLLTRKKTRTAAAISTIVFFLSFLPHLQFGIVGKLVLDQNRRRKLFPFHREKNNESIHFSLWSMINKRSGQKKKEKQIVQMERDIRPKKKDNLDFLWQMNREISAQACKISDRCFSPEARN